MSREAMVEVSAVKAMNAGYEFLDRGNGIYDTVVTHFRNEGYDVKAWYINMKGDKESWTWTLYGKKKSQRRAPKATPVETITLDYNSLNVKQLKKLCSELKIAGYSKMNKDQMIQSIIQAC